jgi:hypothetical protein
MANGASRRIDTIAPLTGPMVRSVRTDRIAPIGRSAPSMNAGSAVAVAAAATGIAIGMIVDRVTIAGPATIVAHARIAASGR